MTLIKGQPHRYNDYYTKKNPITNEKYKPVTEDNGKSRATGPIENMVKVKNITQEDFNNLN